MFSCVAHERGDCRWDGAPAMLAAAQMRGKKRDAPFGIYSPNECNSQITREAA